MHLCYLFVPKISILHGMLNGICAKTTCVMCAAIYPESAHKSSAKINNEKNNNWHQKN